MKRNFGFAFALATALVVTSCSKDDEGVNNPGRATVQQAKYAEYMKNWTSDRCIGSKLIPISDTHFKIEYDFHGDTFVKRYNYYTSAACATQVAQVVYAGVLLIDDSTNEDKFNSKHLNMKFNKVTVKSVNEEGRKFLEVVNLCGQTDFPAGQDVDMTAASTKTLCILQTANGVEYFDRAIVVNNDMFTATAYAEKPTNTDGGKRPDIDESNGERFIVR